MRKWKRELKKIYIFQMDGYEPEMWAMDFPGFCTHTLEEWAYLCAIENYVLGYEPPRYPMPMVI